MERTDLTKWKLYVDRGRQVWKYNPEQRPTEQKFYDKYFLGLDVSKDAPPLPKPKSIEEATRNGIKFYEKLQTEDGHWANDYGGPLFLMPGMIITCYITGVPIAEEVRLEMIRYLSNCQREDGGWGLHIESESTMFGSGMNYVTMRLLGVPKDDARIVKARNWIQRNGGMLGIPHWGKFWMATLGLMEWDGVNAVLPELWSLPYWLPFHPGRFWCHCRVIYLPMAYIYGTKSTGKITPLIKELREEVYTTPYDQINWPSIRWFTNPQDKYRPASTILKVVFGLCKLYDKCPIPFWRKSSVAETLDHIRYEDEQTHYIDIGPVNKCMDMLCEYYATGGKSDAFQQHVERLKDYLWLAADGMKMQGYNGSQLWDTAFSLQGIMDTGLAHEFPDMMKLGEHYIQISQVLENSPNMDKYYRHISKGAWPFSNRDHGWPIADCTAEGLRTALRFKFEYGDVIGNGLPDNLLYDSVNVLLSLQNDDGGWPSYELMRSGAWLENLNPAECFDGIMVDYSYCECSSAAIRTLLLFRKYYPTHRSGEIYKSIERGCEYLKKVQRPDGSWHGSWGVCYTYAAWFGIIALCEAGQERCETVRKACEFLLSKQKEDGGWGEDFRSCYERRYVQYKESHVVNTAWAVHALMVAAYPEHKTAVKRGVESLVREQETNGDWRQQGISGVFNFSCAISYSGYKNIFPIWALGYYISRYPFSDEKLSDKH
jgi:squalene/oxidosqualene cyclase-like protein